MNSTEVNLSNIITDNKIVQTDLSHVSLSILCHVIV
jgi:hypothetical protein